MYLPWYSPAAFAQRDQLLRRRIEARRVDQRRPDAERAVRHLLPHERLHPFELRRGRLAILEPDDVLADGRGADERRDVRRDALLLEELEILRERRPRDVVLDRTLLALPADPHLVGERAHRRSLAEDLGRHALPDVALRAPILDQRLGGPRQHVDEAGRDREAGGVDDRTRCTRDRATARWP